MDPHRYLAFACRYGFGVALLVQVVHLALHLLGVPHAETIAFVP